jgi:ferritin-like metal-binding protein YciE
MVTLTSHKFESLNDVFMHELRDIYDAEHRIADALPKMAGAAHAPRLQQAFTRHHEETKTHIARLEKVFQTLGEEPKRSTCEATKGLVQEGEEAVKAKGDGAAIDAALTAMANKVEHYEIASYGTLRSMANELGRADVAELLQRTLDNEYATDRKAEDLAEEKINPQAKS